VEDNQLKCSLTTYDQLKDYAYYFLSQKLITEPQFHNIMEFLGKKELQEKNAYKAVWGAGE